MAFVQCRKYNFTIGCMPPFSKFKCEGMFIIIFTKKWANGFSYFVGASNYIVSNTIKLFFCHKVSNFYYCQN